MDESNKLLEWAKASPERVAVHDKAGWLALFAPDAVVEDPVGSAPNRRAVGDELGRFYETFIAPNQIRFEAHLDIVVGREVLRDVTIHTRMPSGFDIAVPALLRYEISEVDGGLAVQRLQAHWELPRLSWQTMTGGWRGLVAATGQTLRMLWHMGIRGMLGYMKGMVRGIFGRGRAAVEAMSTAVSDGDAAGLEALFLDSEPRIQCPAGSAPQSASAFMSALGRDGAMAVDKITPAGWVTCCRFELKGELPAQGLAFFDFDPASRKISSARFYAAGGLTEQTE